MSRLSHKHLYPVSPLTGPYCLFLVRLFPGCPGPAIVGPRAGGGLCLQGIDREVILLVPPTGLGVNTSRVSLSPGLHSPQLTCLCPPEGALAFFFSFNFFCYVFCHSVLQTDLKHNPLAFASDCSENRHTALCVCMYVCVLREGAVTCAVTHILYDLEQARCLLC